MIQNAYGSSTIRGLDSLISYSYSSWLEFGYVGRISHMEHLAANASPFV